MSNTPLLLLCAVLLGLAVAAIVWVVLTNRARITLLRRTIGTMAPTVTLVQPIASENTRSPLSSVIDWMAGRVPAQLGTDTVMASRLVHAGYDGPIAASVFAISRAVTLVACLALSVVLAPEDDATLFCAVIVIGFTAGLLAPTTMLNRLAEARMKELRLAIPDAVDLLVVCVEAGVSLDASIQRVAREMVRVHPRLADELMSMTRRVSAGMPREQALHGLYLRTGVDELRSLSAHLLQSDKWGTSIGTVLRLYAGQMRTKRRNAAEKRAATVSTRMLIPLALFIFPTLFVILLGPAVLRISTQF